MNLTPKQIEALKTIADNPGNVVAWTRFSQLKDMIRINGNIEQALSRLGLIREIGTGRSIQFRHQGILTDSGEIKAWELTEEGRAVIAPKADVQSPLMSPDASPTAHVLAEAGQARDEAMREAYEAEGTNREAEADAAYQRADDAYHAAKVAHRAARIAAGDDVKPIAPRPERMADPAPFIFEYDEVTGILMAAALREKAKTHRQEAALYRKAVGNQQLTAFYAERAQIAANNAKLLEDAADKIHGPVKAALVNDTAHAVERTEATARRTKRAKREQSGMDSLRDMLKLA